MLTIAECQPEMRCGARSINQTQAAQWSPEMARFELNSGVSDVDWIASGADRPNSLASSKSSNDFDVPPGVSALDESCSS
jgi:hypothetical protein